MTDSTNSERFKYLFTRYVKNECTAEELEILFAFLRNSSNEALISSFMEDEWDQFKSHSSIKQDHADELLNNILSNIKQNQPVIYLSQKSNGAIFWKIAASFLFIAMVGSYLVLKNKEQFVDFFNPPKLVSFENAAGKRSKITLPDGTTVWLNAESKITYPDHFKRDKRQVELTGEAFFEVVRNVNSPFVITARDLQIKVLGTSFNVKTYENEPSSITVASGKVRVEATENRNVLLVANQQVCYQQGAGFTTIKTIDTKEFLAWKDGTLIFDHKNLKEVVLLLERWYGKKIVLQNEKLNNCSLVGEHTNESLEHVLNTLQFVLGITYEIRPDKIIISGKGCP